MARISRFYCQLLDSLAFASSDFGFFLQTQTNEDGKYILAQGAAIGSNRVYISKFEGGAAAAAANDPTLELNDPTQTEIANQAQAASGKKGPKQLIPPQFSNEKTTKLTFDVPEGGAKDADFNL